MSPYQNLLMASIGCQIFQGYCRAASVLLCTNPPRVLTPGSARFLLMQAGAFHCRCGPTTLAFSSTVWSVEFGKLTGSPVTCT
jgi:hypothetical protein